MTSPLIACAFCKHFIPEIRLENVCAAFPLGIPDEFVYGDIHHLEPYAGDNGIQFEPRPGFKDAIPGYQGRRFKRQIPWARPIR